MTFVDGSDITDVLQAEIDRLGKRGGGVIEVPAGRFAFRPIRLESGVHLRLEAGCRLTASGKREDYPFTGYNHNEMGDVYSAIYALGKRSIGISGEGVIDLNGTAFYSQDKWAALETVGPEVTEEYTRESPRTYDWRPNQPIFFHDCTGVEIRGITITNAPCWTISLSRSKTIRIRDLTIRNGITIPNSDGIHCTSSQDISISGCHITAGDDCVALTGITDWSVPTEDVVISDCVFVSASKAISIGYIHSIVRNVLIQNVVVRRSNRALAVMCHPGTGSITRVKVTNCILEGRSYGGNWWGNGEALVVMATPHHVESYRDPAPEPRFEYSLDDISFSHVTCLSERPIALLSNGGGARNIRMTDVTVIRVAEEKPSLKGNVIDLSPGPGHYPIPDDATMVVVNNIPTERFDARDEDGYPITPTVME